jgi:serine/threonine protein kinase
MLTANEIVGGRYKVVKPLGGGGMKLVYLAEDLRLASRRCALAEMVDTFTSPDLQRQAVAAFQREADMLAQLSNDHIPRVFDRFSEQNHHYLVMEFIDGITLEDALKPGQGRMDEARVLNIALQVLDTLIYLHGLEPAVVYRDLKPSNVMLTPDGQAKLIDFGIARFFQPHSNATMIGTQGYAPPEQYRGKAETRSDLYALGATMHHALSGRDPTIEPPFSFPPVRKAAPNVTPALADLVDFALAYDVERRIPTATEFKRRLIEIRNGEAPSADARVSAPLNFPAGDSSSAPLPTVLTDPSEIRCTRCGTHVPADSKFCSFCANDLRRVLGPGEVIGSEAETTILSDRPGVPPYSSPSDRHGRRERRPGRRRLRLGMVIGLVFLLSAIVKHFNSLDWNRDNPSPPAEVVPPAAPDAPEPIHQNPREIALRQFLDLQGYSAVHFRIVDSNTVELWGSVPTAWDRVVVQGMATTFTGAFQLEDHLRVDRDELRSDEP